MTPPSPELPAFVEPMLAKVGTPFDSDDYLFEVKWDGTRTLAFIDRGGVRLLNRRRVDMTYRYPEFAFLERIGPGAILDGEIVVLKDGKPDFPSLMSREQASQPLKIRSLSRAMPATFVAFDLLYEQFAPLLTQPLYARRERLRQIVQEIGQPQMVFSEGVLGKGKAFFKEVAGRNMEGVMAKRVDSRYLPGQRTDAWIKIKKGETVCCLILGFVPDGKNDFRNLIIAAETDGDLQHVGQVGSGFNNAMRKKLNTLLRKHPRPKPVVPCKIKGNWIEPGMYCLVHCMERTATGHLRAPAFKGLVEG